MDLGEVVQWLDRVKTVGTLLAVILPSALVVYALARCFYNLALHPLRSYPGPLLWRATRLPYDWYAFHGTLHNRIVAIHKHYGPTVRLSPNELSFTSSQARRDILAHIPGREEFNKDFSRSTPFPNGMENILMSQKGNHTRFRRLLSHAFSDKGLREQEPHIRRYVDLLVENLTKRAHSGEEVDLVDWFDMVTFDVIGYLAFGRAFRCLEDGGKLHSWIPNISQSLRFSLQKATCEVWGLGFLSEYLLDAKIRTSRVENFRYAQESVNIRLKEGKEKGDFWDNVLVKSEKNELTGEGMNAGEMLNNSVVLVLGGSETSATVLSGAVLLLLKHPNALKRLVAEIRSSFRTTEDITVHSVHQLKYLLAVLDETMRLYPPVSQQLVRISPLGGGTVLGKFVPEGTVLNPHQLAANLVAFNFRRPDDFVPERWLSDLEAGSEFAGDDRAACQPFSLGTRNCIGKNLAYAETQLILAKLLYHFDLSAGDKLDTDSWFDQKSWAIRWKKPVWVKLKIAEPND